MIECLYAEAEHDLLVMVSPANPCTGADQRRKRRTPWAGGDARLAETMTASQDTLNHGAVGN